MKRIKEFLDKLSTAQKIEAAIASVVTLAVLIAVPVYAWFSSVTKLETLTRVKELDSLDIRAGDVDPIENFELSNIDLEKIKSSHEPACYVFCVVTGSLKTLYDIQIAHTTNIPFKYTLYRAEEVSPPDTGDVGYKPLDESKTIYYKRVNIDGKLTGPLTALALEDLNADTDNNNYYGRTLAKTGDYYYGQTYETGVNLDQPEIYAIPIYSQVQRLKTLNPEHDFYILEIGWAGTDNDTTDFSNWNAAINNKETDIIYITASRTTS